MRRGVRREGKGREEGSEGGEMERKRGRREGGEARRRKDVYERIIRQCIIWSLLLTRV